MPPFPASSSSRTRRQISVDATVVGSGPNGLAAAITLARAGLSVQVREGAGSIGGGTRTEELTLPGFRHDTCAAIHTFSQLSPFLRGIPLEQLGVEWIDPPVQVAHPFDDGSAAVLQRSLDATVAGLGRDGRAYERLLGSLLKEWELLADGILAPLRLPRHPLLMARFGLHALRSAETLARSTFESARMQALFAGLSAHSMVSLDRAGTAAFGIVLSMTAHVGGWLIARGGSETIARALVRQLASYGGSVRTNAPVSDLAELAGSRIVMLDITPRQVLTLTTEALPPRYRRSLQSYRYGPGAFKMDWALSEPVPWTNTECRQAGTLHLGGSFEEILASERAAFHGEHGPRPFMIVTQPSLFDPTRAPTGRHTLWAYCHVPHGSTRDVSEAMENQIERFAPGFRDTILARSMMGPADLEERNANLVGGDIGGGANTIGQIIFRPVRRLNPYSTPIPGVYLCSAATPPGGGVHGMCGHRAALSALARVE